MTQLPKFSWDVDPVFLRVPKEVVVGGLAIFAAISLFVGLRKKAGDQLLTAVIFGGLALLASKYLGAEFELRYYSALFLGVFLGGYSLLKWQIVRGGGRAEDAGDFIVYGVLGVLVGARLGHVIFYDWKKALDDPMWIFQIWTGGLASHGAVLGLITAMWIFTKRRGIPFLEGADRFAFSAALGATLVRIGNLFNSEIIGRPTDQSWGISFPRVDRGVEVFRYPTQFYEITLGLLVLLVLYLVDKKLGKEKRPRGALIATFFAVYFTGRFFIEFYKEYEGIPSSSPLTMGQYLSIPGILIGWIGLFVSLKRKIPVGWPNPDAPDDDYDEDDEEEARPVRRKNKKKKKKKKNKKKGKAAAAAATAAAAGAAAEEPAESERAPDEGEPSRADEDEDREDDAEDDEDRDEDREDDAEDDEDRDEDREDDAEDDEEREDEEGDPDVDDEFDADGRLKKRRKLDEE
jgi:phosphatidylglycerol:prolipoprotein diacylglycerol transferase